MKTNIAVFFGCRSVEHEVSIISAVQAMRQINREKYDVTPVYVAKDGSIRTGKALFDIESYKNFAELFKITDEVTVIRQGKDVLLKFLNQTAFKRKKDIKIDLAFPIVHGTNCEDGTLSGLFEFLDLPYIGCDILSAAVGMDKAVFKDVLKNAGLPVLDYIKIGAREFRLEPEKTLKKIAKEVCFPLIVKPINLGSSVGISKVDAENELAAALNLAFSFTDRVLIEKAVENLREVNCSVLGDSDECFASNLEEPFMTDKILSYEDKYLGGSKGKTGPSKGMASLGRKIPADIPKDKSDYIRELSIKIFKAINAGGVVRIDYLLNDKTGEVFANEINTIPGSLAFYLWEATDLKYTDMIDKLIDTAFKRQRNRENLTFAIDTNILEGAKLGSKGAKGSKT